jgi:hypothetical protein
MNKRNADKIKMIIMAQSLKEFKFKPVKGFFKKRKRK